MKILSPTHCYTLPGIKWVGHALPNTWLFNSSRLAASVAMRMNPHTHRSLKPIHRVLGSAGDAHEIAKRYLIYRKYLNYLERAWMHRAISQRIPALISGKEYLDHALSQGNGAILVSGHAYGFNRLVGSVLTRYGYRAIRGGTVKPENLKNTSGTRSNDPWTYIYLGETPWERLRALKRIVRALDSNDVLHTLVMGHPQHDPALEVQFFGYRFSLDIPTFRFISELNRPILPCFAMCNDSGQLVIHFHASVPNSLPELPREFIALYQGYLNNHPEFVRFWKRLLDQSDFF